MERDDLPQMKAEFHQPRGWRVKVRRVGIWFACFFVGVGLAGLLEVVTQPYIGYGWSLALAVVVAGPAVAASLLIVDILSHKLGRQRERRHLTAEAERVIGLR